MPRDTEVHIRTRAYAIWEAEGRPHGRDLDHWLQAEAETGPPARRPPAPARAESPAEKRSKPAAKGLKPPAKAKATVKAKAKAAARRKNAAR